MTDLPFSLPAPDPLLRGAALLTALDAAIAAIDDRTRYIEVSDSYRAGWVDGLRAVRDDPAIVALAAALDARLEAER